MSEQVSGYLALGNEAAAAGDAALARSLDILQNEAAQQAFAQGGEAGYVAYARQEFECQPRAIEPAEKRLELTASPVHLAIGAAATVSEKELHLQHTLTDEAAQQAFAQGGEAGYLSHVESQLTVEVVERLHRDLDHAEALVLNEQWDRLQENIESIHARIWESGNTEAYANKYAAASAKQRSGHVGRVEQTHERAGWFKKRLRGAHTHATQDALVTEAKIAFEAAFEGYVAARKAQQGSEFTGRPEVSPDIVMDWKFAALDRLEELIQGYREVIAGGGVNESKQTARERFALWFAASWQRSGRLGKGLKVAAPAAALGGTAAFGAVTLGLGPLVTGAVGAGVTFAGRAIGRQTARSVSRRMSATEAGAARARSRAEDRRNALMTRIENAQGSRLEAADAASITSAVEEGTVREVQENRRRLRRAGGVAAAAAILAFSGVEIAHALTTSYTAHHVPAQGNTPPPHPPGTPSPPGGGVTQPGGVLPNPTQYPWAVAHGLVPSGHELQAIQQAMDAWNQVYPAAGYHFAHVGNTVQIYTAHGAALNSGQQEVFNRFMEYLLSGQG